MRIVRVRIKNFRNLADIDVPTRDLAAALGGVSARPVQAAETVRQRDPELFRAAPAIGGLALRRRLPAHLDIVGPAQAEVPTLEQEVT